MPKPKTNKATVPAGLTDAVAALVKARMAKPARKAPPTASEVMEQFLRDRMAKAAKPRRSARRVGFRKYTPTGKYDPSRRGTFRKYMLSTICAHGDTWAANAAHQNCDNPKFAKNKLDFNWAVDNGYIIFI